MTGKTVINIRLPFRILSAIVGWSALTLQLYLMIVSNLQRGIPGMVGVMQFFDYFTILSNILVAIVFTTVCWQRNASSFFAHPRVAAGSGTYVFVTGIGYALLLKQSWNPTGLALMADVALHYMMPLLCAIDWLCFTPKGQLRWNDAVQWLVFPVAFVGWALFWGAVFGFYPYFFMDVATLGYPRVLLNSMFATIGFLTVGLCLVALDRWLSRNTQPKTKRQGRSLL